MPNISEISLHDTIYKIKDDSAATKEYVDAALQNVGNTSVVIQNEEPTDTSVIWIDPDDEGQTYSLDDMITEHNTATNAHEDIRELISNHSHTISNITNLQSSLDNKANKADIASTKYAAASNSAAIYFKISDFGAWGSGVWYQKGFSMLISSRAGEMIWVAVSSDDSNTNAKAIRLLNTYGKILNLYYSVSESAIYVKANAWCNNVCAHIISNLNGDYVANVAQASALASDAVEIKIVEFGATSSGVAIGNSSGTLALTGSGNRPTYNGTNVALQSDIPSLNGYATEARVQEMINAIAIYDGSVS